jgi:excisionase family DNA binding protein
MKTVSNDSLIRSIFNASDEAKAKALAVLEGREALDTASGPLLLTMGEAAELLNVSRATLWRTIKSGRLEKVELYPGAYRLRRADVVALANGKVVARD